MKLHELPLAVQQRIREQLARDDAEAARLRRDREIVVAGLRSWPQPEPDPGPALVRDAPAQGGSKGGTGGRGYYRVTFTVWAVRPRDVDNLAASCKQILDELVRAGWLPGDDWKTVEAAWVSAKADKAHPVGTEITIERVA